MIFDIKERLIIPNTYFEKRDFSSDEMYYSQEGDLIIITISYYNKQILDIFVIKDKLVINKFKIKYNKFELPKDQKNIFTLNINHNIISDYDTSLQINEDIYTFMEMTLNHIQKIFKKYDCKTYNELIEHIWYKFDKTNEVSYRRKLLLMVFISVLFSKTNNFDLCQVVHNNKFNEFKIQK